MDGFEHYYKHSYIALLNLANIVDQCWISFLEFLTYNSFLRNDQKYACQRTSVGVVFWVAIMISGVWCECQMLWLVIVVVIIVVYLQHQLQHHHQHHHNTTDVRLTIIIFLKLLFSYFTLLKNRKRPKSTPCEGQCQWDLNLLLSTYESPPPPLCYGCGLLKYSFLPGMAEARNSLLHVNLRHWNLIKFWVGSHSQESQCRCKQYQSF